MDAFGYLSVLLSIIIGLGITQLLTAGGRLIRHRAQVRFYWPPLLWAAVIVVIFIQMWWSMFGLRTLNSWGFLAFIVVLLQPIMVYMMAAVVLPENIESEAVDLRDHFEAQHRWMFGFFLATLIVSVVKEETLSGRLPLGANLAFHIFLIVACVSGIAIKSRRFHEVLALLIAMAIGSYIAALFATLR
ncbi:MAG: hypothetical protein ABI446_15215 [Gemmatimonadaceae bacterium]